MSSQTPARERFFQPIAGPRIGSILLRDTMNSEAVVMREMYQNSRARAKGQRAKSQELTLLALGPYHFALCCSLAWTKSLAVFRRAKERLDISA